jgi:hypothetical protein
VFGGAWKVAHTCLPADGPEGDRGSTYRFLGEAPSGMMRAELGKAGEPGWQYLHGADGNAVLTLDGIVGNADYTIGRSRAGKALTYALRARVDAVAGEGQ